MVGPYLRRVARSLRARFLLPVSHEILVLAKETASLREQTASLNEQTASLREQTASLREQTASLREHTASLREHTASLREHTASFREQIASLREQVASSHGQIASLREQTASLREQIASFGEQIASLREQVASSHEQIATLHAITASASSSVGNLKDRIEQLEVLLTEHPKIDSRGLTKTGFLSPVISVVMPTWNRAVIISDAINSVQAQLFTDWELVIIDDGSTDNTAEIVAAFAGDRRIRYVKQPHTGQSAARNHGLRLAQGSLIAYLDSDNLWYPEFMAAAVAAFAADPTIDSAYGALISEAHGERILFAPFDRKRLLKGNCIDINTFVHRRSLVDTHGKFDEMLDRLVDWDLMLRYTQHTPARRLPVLAARYRALDAHRVSNDAICGTNYLRISRKWREIPNLSRPLRVLYVLWHYPQLSETYIETEILCMKRWGAHIEVWSASAVASPYEASVPVHRGSLEEAIAACQPDILHVHWLSFAISQSKWLLASGLPLTVRSHGFDVTNETVDAVLALPTLRRAFCFPHQIAHLTGESRLVSLASAFDTSLFRPEPDKDRRLVVRTGAALPSKDLDLLFDVAKRLPNHRFVIAVVTSLHKESYVGELTQALRHSGSPAELMVDVPRDRLLPLVERAALYLHTVTPPDRQDATPIGMPISIAEAMATGAHVLVRDLPPLISYVGPAGSGYRNAEHAAELIAETAAWTETKWKQAWTRSVDRAFMNYADELVLLPLFDEWCAIAGEQGVKAPIGSVLAEISA